GVIVVLSGVLLYFARFHPVISSSWPATLQNALERLVFLAAFLGAGFYFVTRPEHRRLALLALMVLTLLGFVRAIAWQNPTLDASVFDPDLGKQAAKLKVVPTLGESRLMMSSPAAHQIYYKPANDLKTTYLLDRAVFLSDCNLLDGIPKVDGFFSLYL